MKLLLPSLLLLASFAPAQAEVLVGAQARNHLTVHVSVEISRDPATHVYTYSYTVSNDPSSQQSVDNFAFAIAASTPVIEAAAPTGWSFGRYSHQEVFEFSSTEGITQADRVPLPGGGYAIKSRYDIRPGASLCCFVIKTLSRPVQGKAYLQGYAPLPQTRGADEYEPASASSGLGSDKLEDNSFVVRVEVPKGPSASIEPSVVHSR